MIFRHFSRLSLLAILMLNGVECLGADQYYDYSVSMARQGKFQESLRYIDFSISKQKRADNLYQKSLCLRSLGKVEAAQEVLNEIRQNFPNAPEAREGEGASVSVAHAAAPERFAVNMRGFPPLKDLNDPLPFDQIRDQKIRGGADGIYWTEPNEVFDYLSKARSQAELAKSALNQAEAKAKSQIRSQNFGESVAHYREFVSACQRQIDNVIEPYKSYRDNAAAIYYGWLNLSQTYKRRL